MADPTAERGYERVSMSLRRIVINNFLGGIAWGLGTVFGASIVVGAIIWLLSLSGVLAPVSDLVKNFQESVETLRNIR